MATQRQRMASKKNIKKALRTWKFMTPRERALAQPNGKRRLKPGSTGEGNYYRIEIREKSQFSSFRNHDVGEKGGIQRIAGHRPSGSWDTQAWLIEKTLANVVGDTLKSRHKDVQEIIDSLGSKPKHIKGDLFQAKPERNVPEKDKPTEAMKKAYEARRKN